MLHKSNVPTRYGINMLLGGIIKIVKMGTAEKESKHHLSMRQLNNSDEHWETWKTNHESYVCVKSLSDRNEMNKSCRLCGGVFFLSQTCKSSRQYVTAFFDFQAY